LIDSEIREREREEQKERDQLQKAHLIYRFTTENKQNVASTIGKGYSGIGEIQRNNGEIQIKQSDDDE